MWYLQRYYIHPGWFSPVETKVMEVDDSVDLPFQTGVFFRFQALIFQCPCWPSSFLLPQSLATCCQVDVNGQVSVEAIDSGSGKSVLVLKKVDLGTQGIFWRETNSSPEQVYSWKDVHFPSHHFWYLYIKLNFGVVGCCRFWFQILFYVYPYLRKLSNFTSIFLEWVGSTTS